MKEQVKTHISQEGMENGTFKGKRKKEGMINPKFNVINVTKIYTCRSSINNLEGQTNYVERKKKKK